MNGYIFNIQKFCLHDGPGIRTTVFFKGCNLRCKWCANPESQSMERQLTLDRSKCLGCGKCVPVCPASVRTMQNGFPSVDEAACSGCGLCMDICPAGAVGREGRTATVAEILAEAVKDKPFYDHSGGGVTLSGGEVLMQQEFATELARALHGQGISVAIETAAAVEPARFRSFLREIDFAYIDLKHHDNARHLDGTGVGNAQVLENIRIARESGVAFRLRIPVIPGYNDSPEDAEAFACLLLSLEIAEVQLLPFHQMGERKYGLLGRDYAYAGTAQLHGEDLQEYRQIFERHGIHVEL